MTPWLSPVVDAAVWVAQADMANVQLVSDGALRIAASRGFGADFLAYFDVVRDVDSACGAALAQGTAVVVDDIRASAIFTGKPSLDAMLAAGCLSVASVPLTTATGTPLGMLSAHRRAAGGFDAGALQRLDWLARQTAALLDGSEPAMAMRAIEILARAGRGRGPSPAFPAAPA